MNYWRMAFRMGSQGQSLWPECYRLGVAAITYPPFETIDLSKYQEGKPESSWAKLAPTQKASLRRVAYEMKAGDIIYVKEGPKIVGKGLVKGSYKFDTKSRIVDANGFAWPHQVPVEWLPNFKEKKLLLGGEQVAVKPLDPKEVQRIDPGDAAFLKSNQRYFAKLCWNTQNWICPSGDAAKVESKGTYCSKMRFGHEEWLFNLNWLLDGWKYSFLQPVNKSRATVKGKTINVRLFTVGGKGRWYYVGEITECEILTPEQAEYARTQFRARGWLQQMEKHVREVGGNVSGLKDSDPLNLFNIRFRSNNVEIYDPLLPVDENDAIKKIKRYQLASVINSPKADRQWSRRIAATTARPTGKIHRKGVAARNVDLVHNEIQNELIATLKAKYGDDAVIVEENFVDIKLKDKKRLILLEVKADPQARRALREAMGQLLEYEFVSFTIDGEEPTELIVVGPGSLTERDIDYMHHLQNRWSLPIKYLCLHPENGDFQI